MHYKVYSHCVKYLGIWNEAIGCGKVKSHHIEWDMPGLGYLLRRPFETVLQGGNLVATSLFETCDFGVEESSFGK